MPETTLRFTADAKGAITGIEQLSGKLKQLDTSAQQSKGGLAGMAGGLNNLKAGFDMVSGALGGVISVTGELINLGTASRQARESFDTLSKGNTTAYLDQMRTATRGLIPDIDLMKSATKAMVLGLAQSGDQLATLSKAGTVLGRVMGIDAAQGVETLTVAMSRVGQTMLLDNIGLSANTVMNRFKELKATMSDQDAWSAAVLEEAALKAKALEGNLDGAGAGVQRLGVAFDGLKTSAGANLSYLLDMTIKLTEALDKADKARYKASTAPAGVGTPGTFTPTGQSITPADMMATAAAIDAANKAKADADKYKNLFLSNEAMLQGLLRGAFSTDSILASSKWTVSAPSGYDKQYTDFVSAQQNQSDLAKRAAVRRYSGMPALGAQLGDLGSATLGGSFTALGDALKRQAAVPDALKTLNQIVSGGKAIFEPYAKGINTVAQAWDNLAEAQKKKNAIQSIDQAFQLGTKDGLYGEVGGGMGEAAQTRRDALQAELERKYGKGSKRTQAGLDAFDNQAKAAIDAYAIATGSATRESIKYRDILAKINSDAATGRISMSQYKDLLLEMAKAAKDGATSMGDLDTALYREQVAGIKGDPTLKAKDKRTKIELLAGDSRVRTDSPQPEDKKKDSGITDMTKQVGELNTKIDSTKVQIGLLPAVVNTHFTDAADKTKPLQDALNNINQKTAAALTMRAGVRIIIETFNPGTGGGRSGGDAGAGGRPF